MRPWVLGGVLVLLAITASTVGAAEYAITVDSGIDTPDRQVSLEGSTFTVRGIAAVDPGDTITASVTSPTNDGFRVYVYGTSDGARALVDAKYVGSGSTVQFSTSGYDPGTYTFALDDDGDYRAVYPFIVSGATIDVTAPATAAVGESVTASAAVSATDPDVDVTGVEFVLHGPGGSKRVSASGDASPYEATFDTDGLAAGDYSIYAVVTNDSRTPTGDPEPVGLSTEQSIIIESQPTTESGSGGGSTSTTTTTSTTATTTTQTTQTSSTATTTTTQSTTPTSGTPSTETTTPATSTTTNSSVITPNTQTTTPATSPGFTALTAGLASVAALLLFRRPGR